MPAFKMNSAEKIRRARNIRKWLAQYVDANTARYAEIHAGKDPVDYLREARDHLNLLIEREEKDRRL
jgi:hypothetical protein